MRTLHSVLINLLRTRRVLVDVGHKDQLIAHVKDEKLFEIVTYIRHYPALMNLYGEVIVDFVKMEIANLKSTWSNFQRQLERSEDWLQVPIEVLEINVEMFELLFDCTRHKTFHNHNVVFEIELFLIRRQRILYGVHPALEHEEVIDQNQLDILDAMLRAHNEQQFEQVGANVLPEIQVAEHELGIRDSSPDVFKVLTMKALDEISQLLLMLLRRRPVLYSINKRLLRDQKIEAVDQIMLIIKLHPVLGNQNQNITSEDITQRIKKLKCQYSTIQKDLNDPNKIWNNKMAKTKEIYVELSGILLDNSTHVNFSNVDLRAYPRQLKVMFCLIALISLSCYHDNKRSTFDG